ncbi:MAG: T9SS type A sorting domain-containing protein [bacterium]
MKKLIFFYIALMLILGQAIAQTSYEVYDNSSGSAVKVLNGAVLSRSMKASETDYQCPLTVKNVSAVPCVSWVRKYYVNIVPGTTNWFCWDGCYFPHVMVCKSPVKINSGDVFDGFDAHYNAAGKPGESKVKFVVYNGSNRNDSIGFDIVFKATVTGYDELVSQGADLRACPNPAVSNLKFVYSKLTGEAAFAVVKNIVGKEICRLPLQGISGDLAWNVDSYPNGIYFYSIECGGKIVSTRKLIIQH